MRLRRAAAVLLFCGLAWGGVLTGKFSTPQGPVANGTLVLTLSQAAILPGTTAVVPASFTCYTSTQGNVVGVPDPLQAPAVSAEQGDGTLPAGTYYVEVTNLPATSGESAPSPETVVTLPAAGALSISFPSAAPAGASIGVYIGTASGAETRQAVAEQGTPYLQSAPLASGLAPPVDNTSSCSFTFNDAMVPAPTFYTATLTDSGGNVVPGFPQDWLLEGTSVNVSSLLPLSSPPGLSFADPLQLNPPTNADQSVASGLNLNGNYLDNTANVGPGFISVFWSGSLPAGGYYVFTWTPNSAVLVRRLSVDAQTAGDGGTAGSQFEIVQGSGVCTFPGLLAGATTTGSAQGNGAGCILAAGSPATIEVQTDDHTTRPANVNFVIEVTAQ